MFDFLRGIVFISASVAFIVWIGNVIRVAFISKKDEQDKMVITKAMAQSFKYVLIINLIIVINQFLNSFGVYLITGIEVHPIVIYLIIFGLSIAYNKRLLSKGGEQNGM